jgi:predicted  nucleic acid-binding Zn-ribbon protein
MKAEVEAILRLQSLDLRIADLEKEIESLPKHVTEIEKKLDAFLRRLDADRAALAANLRERKNLEDDIKTHQGKISKLRDQMMQAKTNEQYRAFQNEISFAEGEIRKCEDRILDLMTAAEPLEAAVKKAESALAERRKEVEAEQERARKRTAEDEAFLQKARLDRSQVSAEVTPQLLRQYEQIRKRGRGLAVSDATNGTCEACHIALRPQYFQELRRGEKLLNCETCGRILYYKPPVTVEHELHQK